MTTNNGPVQHAEIFKRRPPYLVIGIVVAYLLMMFATPFPDQLLLYPTTDRIDARGAERKTIPFQNGKLEIWTQRSQLAKRSGNPDFCVLRFYGNADRAERWAAVEADMFNNRSVELWGVNFPGFGGSTGPATLRRMADSALIAFDAVKKIAREKPIIVYGASIGTTAALHVAAQRRTAGLILHNPPALRDIILRNFGWWNLWLLAGPVAAHVPRDLDSIANAKRVHAPAVFLLAEKDELVAPRFQQLVVNAYGGEKRAIVLPGAHHNSVLEGTIMADVYKAYDWLLAKR